MLNTCLKAASEKGFKRCYLETLKIMVQARRLYERNGFREIEKPLGNTGHFSCDAQYLKEL
jgi:putative acetyltransferase